MLATVNLNAPQAPQGKKRFLDYFNELKDQGLVKVQEDEGSERSDSFKTDHTGINI
jgi:hypothetical protein